MNASSSLIGIQPSFRNPLDSRLPRRIRAGVWASIVSAVMLIGIGIFWAVDPVAAAEGAFAMTADSDSAIRFARAAAIFKAVGDVLPPIFILLALGLYQFRLAGMFHLFTLGLVIVVDMITWSITVPEAGAQHILMHAPFAVPIIIAAWCFLTSPPSR